MPSKTRDHVRAWATDRRRIEARGERRPCAYCLQPFAYDVHLRTTYCNRSCAMRARSVGQSCPVPWAQCHCGAWFVARIASRTCPNHRIRRLTEKDRQRICRHCGVPFRATHGLQVFCTTEHKDVFHNPVHGPLPHTCTVCRKVFESKNPNARYCSNRCRRKVHRKALPEYQRRRSAAKVRRLRPRIIERWGLICYLCGRPIEYGPSSSHALAFTLDHVKPIALGGTDDEENLRPAHRGCNEDKGEHEPMWWQIGA